jgi:FtsH Extracellular
MMRNPPNSDASAAPHNGRPKASKEGTGRSRRLSQPWWVIFLLVLSVNYVATQLFFSESSSITIPYTFFKMQVEAGNVEDVTSVGDSIQGRLRRR